MFSFIRDPLLAPEIISFMSDSEERSALLPGEERLLPWSHNILAGDVASVHLSLKWRCCRGSGAGPLRPRPRPGSRAAATLEQHGEALVSAALVSADLQGEWRRAARGLGCGLRSSYQLWYTRSFQAPEHPDLSAWPSHSPPRAPEQPPRLWPYCKSTRRGWAGRWACSALGQRGHPRSAGGRCAPRTLPRWT